MLRLGLAFAFALTTLAQNTPTPGKSEKSIQSFPADKAARVADFGRFPGSGGFPSFPNSFGSFPGGFPGSFPGSSGGFSGGFPSGFPSSSGSFPGSSGGFSGGFPGGFPSGFPGSSGGFSGGFPGGFPSGFPGSSAGGFPGGFPSGFAGSSGSSSGGFPGGFPSGFPGSFPGGFPGRFPGGFPGSFLGGFPGSFPGAGLGQNSDCNQATLEQELKQARKDRIEAPREKGDFASSMLAFAPDVLYVTSGVQTIRNRNDLQAYLQPLMSGGSGGVKMTAQRESYLCFGPYAAEIGSFQAVDAENKVIPGTNGRDLVIWKRISGLWSIAYMFNVLETPAQSPKSG